MNFAIRHHRPASTTLVDAFDSVPAVMPRRSVKSSLATVIGWVIVAVLIFWSLEFVIGTIRFVLRFVVFVAVLGVLLTAYLRLRADD